MRRLALYLLVPVVAAGGLTACDKESVHVGFRPEAGASYRYEIKVQSVTTTVLGDEAPERSVDEVTLESQDTVLSAAPEEARVKVQLRRVGSPVRTFQVRFDRGGRLAGVDAVDGLPPAVLGPVGLPEFLPAAATAPPDKALSPGEKWKIEAEPTRRSCTRSRTSSGAAERTVSRDSSVTSSTDRSGASSPRTVVVTDCTLIS